MAAEVRHGDAASVLRAMPAASVDMIYLDPPFGTQVDWVGKAGRFSDKFKWDDESKSLWAQMTSAHPVLASILEGATVAPRDRAYLVRMVLLFAELRRVLHPAGTLWLHCDDTMSAYLRLALDGVFGIERAMGGVIWKRTNAHNTARSFGRVHDSIFVYGLTRAAKWRLHRTRHPLIQGDPCEGAVVVDGFIDKLFLNPTSKERVGYPTQKPVALLEQFIAAATMAGDVVLDPTCGSGTTLVAATKMGRRAIGIDASADACAVARRRLAEMESETNGKACRESGKGSRRPRRAGSVGDLFEPAPHDERYRNQQTTRHAVSAGFYQEAAD
ncbi:site-specific DNA-methyltransferase [Reyranella sp.]|jgi:site-specific DNA-methyltransferase (adenine-specific)|uniref:DNA-methyltransferase n=1 Tax=Reyranella sp. TaxID=1929291 RepID=UPI000BD26560|nr:site-specific DNA-methyltransferase [Reyranella sp.]OYY44022.1 MAG: hypothetical protein B7Y57_07510 [Rhodospirillales bacterium 35-66-84]OYZ94698.1 MAG: hypothetical protein B7Y08_10390 [Rhodospirillales bacterium 24-66-33]OZB26228.1 MAG: hypothetical protein B7X63_09820 [Rhodospirillales bacterium 39-66-50]HQS15053.1 site-specific DNA-methyltransferase [Reyranella sp.]HQT10862.1 site-specific DNA-methyltransferase [Reyranella sp.]